MKCYFPYLFVVVFALVVLGCAESDMHQVSGNVTFDGAPIEDGRILFRNLDGDQRAYSDVISNGSYSVACEPGKMRVEITATRIIPGKFTTENDEKEPVGEMYIPAKYNTESELTVEVNSANRHHSFDLKSK